MCVTVRDVELCRTCGDTVVDEGPSKLERCHLYEDRDEDMQCMTLENGTNEFVSHDTDCSSCSYARFEQENAHFDYANSTGGSSNDTEYSQRIGYSDEEEEGESADESDDD